MKRRIVALAATAAPLVAGAVAAGPAYASGSGDRTSGGGGGGTSATLSVRIAEALCGSGGGSHIGSTTMQLRVVNKTTGLTDAQAERSRDRDELHEPRRGQRLASETGEVSPA